MGEYCESSRLPEVGEVPHWPEHHVFLRRQFGKSKVVSRAFQGSLFGTFWVIFYACFSANEIGIWEATRSSPRRINFPGGACPQTPYSMVCFARHPSFLIEIWPDRDKFLWHWRWDTIILELRRDVLFHVDETAKLLGKREVVGKCFNQGLIAICSKGLSFFSKQIIVLAK